MYTTSVIVVANHNKEVKKLFTSLKYSNFNWEANELIIYCNGTDPKLVQWLYRKKEDYTNMIVISSPHKAPFTNCINVAVQLSNSPKLCFIYEDMRVPRSFQSFLDEEYTLYCGQAICSEKLAPAHYIEHDISTEFNDKIIHFPMVISKNLFMSVGGFEIMYPNGIFITEDLLLKVRLLHNIGHKLNKYMFEYTGIQYIDAQYLKDEELAHTYFVNKWSIPYTEIFISGKFHIPNENVKGVQW